MTLLFDLDGTLTNPETGITRCLAHALERMGREPPPLTELRRFIGPPLWTTFAELLETEDRSVQDQAVAHYRERFGDVGLFENEPYAGIDEALSRLRAAGRRLFVVTSKPTVYAARIVERFGLDAHFENVYGSELSGVNTDKRDLVAHVLAREELSASRTCMIGDRGHDVRGGRVNGTRTMGVLWGFGSEQELRDAGADALAASLDGLVAALLGTPPGS